MNSKIPLIERDSEVELHSAPVSQSTAYSVISKDTTQECFAAREGGGGGGGRWVGWHFLWKNIWKTENSCPMKGKLWCAALKRILTKDNLWQRCIIILEWCFMCKRLFGVGGWMWMIQLHMVRWFEIVIHDVMWFGVSWDGPKYGALWKVNKHNIDNFPNLPFPLFKISINSISLFQ